MVLVNYGEFRSSDAKKMAADSFKRLSDTYNAIVLKITDSKEEDWYGVEKHTYPVISFTGGAILD
ncbi:hypothetical protein [Peribacillus sp. SCS-37]|uniref:hypothetical protein n=1 Tax=Paraperibacillus esterisolvens TaxID=3115296 RepID=UPI003906BF61